MSDTFYSSFLTAWGTGAVYATELGIYRVDLPDNSRLDSGFTLNTAEIHSSLLTEHASELLQRYFNGERVELHDIPVDLRGMSMFRYNVLNAIRLIPYGEVRSYAQIAALCGSPHAARAIGGAMASNPVPIILPCHRVVGATGRLTGFSGPGGEMGKMRLLKMEGVEFKGLLVAQKTRVMNRTTLL